MPQRILVEKCTGGKSLPGRLRDKMNTVAERVRARAFSLYEARGRADGSDVEDWLQAEREIASSPAAEAVDRKDRFLWRVALNGFQARDVRVTATPEALFIEAGIDAGPQLLRRIDLPSALDIGKVTASLDQGTLQVSAPKAERSNGRSAIAQASL